MAGNKVIGVDIGGTNLRAALFENHKLKKYLKIRTPKEKGLFISELFRLISSLMEKDVIGIGVASPGPLKNGVIKNPPNLPIIHNFNLKKAIEKKFKKKTIVANDAFCVALAESVFGCKKKNFIILTLGTGIGGGIIIDGKQYNGKGYGGELGHIILDNKKDFETLAASKALKKLTLQAFGKELIINDLLKMKNEKAEAIVDKIADYLGQGIASLIHVFDPEVVVIAGGIKETGSVFLNKIKKNVRKYLIFQETTKIEWSRLEHPGTLGASLLIDKYDNKKS